MSGKWWNTFGYLLVLGMLVSALSYVFSLPYMFLSIKTIVVGEEPSTYALAFGVLLSTLGQYLLQLVAFVGIGVRFFSLREQKEHAALRVCRDWGAFFQPAGTEGACCITG